MRFVLVLVSGTFLSAATPVAAQAEHTDTVWRSTVGTRTVTVVNQWETTPLTGTYTVRVLDESDTSLEIPLSNARGTVSKIGVWNDRLIVVVRKTASVIDVTAATVVDEFLCDSPAISEDGRIVTYHPVSSTGEVQPTTLTYEMGPPPN
jgi:hypothetical protein